MIATDRATTTYRVDLERAPWIVLRKRRGSRRRLNGPARRLVVRTRDGHQVVTRLESPDKAGHAELVRRVYYDLASCSAAEFLGHWVIRAAREQPVTPTTASETTVSA